VYEDDHGSFGFDLGVDHEGLDGAIAVLEGNVFVMAGRGFEAGLGPVLGLGGGGGEGEEKSGGEERESARFGEHHAEEFSTRREDRQVVRVIFLRDFRRCHAGSIGTDGGSMRGAGSYGCAESARLSG
jgi:hypothetical protein